MNDTLITLVAALAVTSASPAQDYRYALFHIPVGLDGRSNTVGIASDGTVLGYSASSSSGRNVLWKNGNIDFLESSGATAINGGLDIVGSNLARIATLWRNDGAVIELGTLGGETSSAYDINDLAQVIGYAELPEGHEHQGHMFLWQNGEMRDIGRFGTSSLPNAINNRSQIVGHYLPIDSRVTSPFLWEDGVFTALPKLDKNRVAFAHDINDDGIIVGWSDVILFGHAVVWIDGEIIDLHDTNNVRRSSARVINNLGVIGGTMNVKFGQGNVGFITENDRMINLNDHLPPRRRWDITRVNDLNDFGQIAGRDVDRDRGVILSPVTPTLALSGPDPGEPGQSSRLTVTGCDPGARVYFLYGPIGGGMAIPGCDLQTGAALQISSPTLAGTAVANQNGEATLTRFVPTAAQGRIFLIQAAQPTGCKVSQLVVHRFE